MDLANAKILIVDDNDAMRGNVRELMKDLGLVSIDEASNGRVGLALFESNHYDLVLTDWNMPFVNGLELLRRIRRACVGSKTPVVLLSSDVSEARALEALSAGASEFLGKASAPTKLREQVLRLVSSLAPKPDFGAAPFVRVSLR